MEEDKVIHSGLLFLPSNSKLSLKKSWQQKFCMLYTASKLGIERLEIYDGIDEARKNSPYKIITLENCIKVTKKSQTYFSIVTKSGTYEFSTSTEADLNEWISGIQEVAFKNGSSKSETLVEDNDLYCTTGEGIFSVKLCETDASIKCNLKPKFYILALTSTAVQLKDIQSNKLLFTWPYQFIRRYGYSSGKFTFEAGRKCDSGEGKFLLEHANEQEVFRYLIMKMKSMKKLLKAESVNSLDCGDKQFQAVLNMEARSRSPLPPSLMSSTTLLHDFESAQSVTIDLGEKLSLKPPQKPPRRNIGALLPQDSYETVSKYDEIEFRDNAWITFGTSDVKHNEESNECDYLACERRSPLLSDNSVSEASKVITEIAMADDSQESYDKLNFFGSSNKLNFSGYKQVRATNANSSQSSMVPPSNEYDEVHTFQSIRPADDSHLGYAVIRKKEAQKINHKSFNDTEYAIISKPKRV